MTRGAPSVALLKHARPENLLRLAAWLRIPGIFGISHGHLARLVHYHLRKRAGS